MKTTGTELGSRKQGAPRAYDCAGSTTRCLDVIVVNWNAGAQLLECVKSVIDNGDDVVSDIIVVDNDSRDGSDAAIRNLPGVRLVQAEQNLGFGRACNLGAGLAGAEYILFLNPDARVYEDTLSAAVRFMTRPDSGKVAICGVQLVDASGKVARSCSRFPSVGAYLAHATGVDRLVPGLGQAMREWDHSDTRAVDQIIGAFFLMRRRVFESLDGFDERFFMYGEEVDLSYRASQQGWQSVYLADVKAFHAGGGTSRRVMGASLFYTMRSRILYAFKHFTLPRRLAILVTTVVVEPIGRTIDALARGSLSSLRFTWTAYAMLFRWLPDWIFRGTTR